jgi:hypothetical protein
MGGLAVVTMTTGGRSEQVDLGAANLERLRRWPDDARVAFGRFAWVEEASGIAAMSPAGSCLKRLLTKLT